MLPGDAGVATPTPFPTRTGGDMEEAVDPFDGGKVLIGEGAKGP